MATTNPQFEAPKFDYDEFTKRNIGFVSEAEQKRLKHSRILIIGVGGMGGVALQCLVRAGIGRFIIADIDDFEVSNLNRQIFSNMDNMGRPKAEVTQAEVKRINPECDVRALGNEWIDQLDELLPQVDVVINGCDDVRATVYLMRKAKEHNKTVIDAFASPLPSAYVVLPTDPRPEETFGYPTVGKELKDITVEDAKKCASLELEYVMTQSSSVKHVHLEIAAEMVTGKRKRISFAPMVWATGVLMSYEAVRALLGKDGGPGPMGVFLNPWQLKYEKARRLPSRAIKRVFVKRFFKSMTQAAPAILAAVTLFLSGCLDATSDSLDEHVHVYRAQGDIPAAHFMMGDFGGLNSQTLETNAIPWKLAMTFVVLRENRLNPRIAANESSIPQILSKYGFITPDRVGNWPQGFPQPRIRGPVGIVKGKGHMIGSASQPTYEVEIANVQCAACHSGRSYDSQGLPTRSVWLGMPNTSIDIDGYVSAVYEGFKESIDSKEATMRAIRRVFPRTTEAEFRTLDFMFGTVRQRVNQIKNAADHATPFSNGNPGVTNGVASLKRMLGVINGDRYHDEQRAFTAVPDLADRGLRSSLLYDGVYSLNGQEPFAPLTRNANTDSHLMDLGAIIGFFNVPVMGQNPQSAYRNLPKALRAVEFLKDYRPQPFPGAIDETKARAGAALYARNCTGCHGVYTETRTGDLRSLRLASFPNRLISASQIGTDPQRANLIDERTSRAVTRSEMGRVMDSNRSGGYVAPILTGLWASAPYLHNGSVPTLWHLMNPEARPTTFQVGGHKLDFTKVGIDGLQFADGSYIYPSNYVPWSQPYTYNTAEAGRRNTGHVAPFNRLTPEEKMALIEYLKLL